MVEGDSFLLSVRIVGIMLPLSEVKRTESGSIAEVAYDPKGKCAFDSGAGSARSSPK